MNDENKEPGKEKEEIDFQAEYLKVFEENKKLKSRNDELFKVIVSFNGQKPVNPESEQKSTKKIDIKDIKF